ncbi:MAG: hypothetical protein K8R67_19490 [Desulfobacteraceae bacterium]|nr:hypothetical protein [Desulfobacteraceae bacterium]
MSRLCIACACLVIGSMIFSSLVLAEEDQIYTECKSNPRGPWCYQEAVEQLNEPVLCENILKYWPKAQGVHGWCYYQLALKYKDCALCDFIQKADIKKMCKLDVCK